MDNSAFDTIDTYGVLKDPFLDIEHFGHYQ